jgi:hypothetical protein
MSTEATETTATTTTTAIEVAPGTNGGNHVVGTPLTTSLTEKYAPGLLRNSVDERIVKINPMSTPIDQISRCAGARSCGSMTVEYYSVDTKKTETTLKDGFKGGSGIARSPEMHTYIINTNDDAIFEVSETILMPEVKGVDENGNEAELVLYVYSRPDSGGIEVYPVNGTLSEDGYRTLPRLNDGVKLVRMGRAATELDVQTAQFSALPRKANNNCQIFKMQVEQSTMQKIAEKEVGWSFSDQEEAAIIDMRLGMEKNFLFGMKSKIFDPSKNEQVYLTGGIWAQTTHEHMMPLKNVKNSDLVELCSAAFTGTGGSKRKILIAGTKLVEALSNAEFTKTVNAGETQTIWGIKFREIQSNFGSLYVVHSEVFDQCGHEQDGFVLDPEYLTKYCHVPFSVEKLDLRRSGVRNTDAVVITEASCLVLRFPDAHMRIIGEEDANAE